MGGLWDDVYNANHKTPKFCTYCNKISRFKNKEKSIYLCNDCMKKVKDKYKDEFEKIFCKVCNEPIEDTHVTIAGEHYCSYDCCFNQK
ncbi:MAG: hypothetical protein ACOCQR_02595 [bacterium]